MTFRALALGACFAAAQSAPATFEEIVESVNSQNAGWVAEVPSRFDSMEAVSRVCGTVLRSNSSFVEMDWRKTNDREWEAEIPSDFDVRTAWPQCASLTGHIRDQSECGSCWAFASTEAFNDRRCIATGDTTLLSVEDTVGNCGFLRCFSMGCKGGQPGMAWKWFKRVGVVTGGDFSDIGKGNTCAPYSIHPCHPGTGDCDGSIKPTPEIGSKCTEAAYPKKYSEDKKKASSSYSLGSIKAIQQDIMKYGSASAAITVYADLPTYKGGVYSHTTDKVLGGHAIKMMGWGTEAGQDYWLMANSWGDRWGEQGTFKIKRGTDESGIESHVVAGTAAVASAEELIV